MKESMKDARIRVILTRFDGRIYQRREAEWIAEWVTAPAIYAELEKTLRMKASRPSDRIVQEAHIYPRERPGDEPE